MLNLYRATVNNQHMFKFVQFVVRSYKCCYFNNWTSHTRLDKDSKPKTVFSQANLNMKLNSGCLILFTKLKYFCNDFFPIGTNIHNFERRSFVDGGGVPSWEWRQCNSMELCLWLFWSILSQGHSFSSYNICSTCLLCDSFHNFLLQAVQQLWCPSKLP